MTTTTKIIITTTNNTSARNNKNLQLWWQIDVPRGCKGFFRYGRTGPSCYGGESSVKISSDDYFDAIAGVEEEEELWSDGCSWEEERGDDWFFEWEDNGVRWWWKWWWWWQIMMMTTQRCLESSRAAACAAPEGKVQERPRLAEGEMMASASASAMSMALMSSLSFFEIILILTRLTPGRKAPGSAPSSAVSRWETSNSSN